MFFEIYVNGVYKGTTLESLRHEYVELLVKNNIINKLEIDKSEIEFKLINIL